MKHPETNEWMELLYQEASPQKEAELREHLATCPGCKQQFEKWRGTQGDLELWKYSPLKRKSPVRSNTAWRWAAAAVLLLTTTFAAGRFSYKTDLTALRNEFETPLQRMVEQKVSDAQKAITASLTAKMQETANAALIKAQADSDQKLQAIAFRLAELQEEQKKTILATLKEIETQHLKDLLALRKDLETVALQADQSLRQAQRQLVQLANYSQPLSQ